MNKPTLTVLCGLQCSGKSTWGKSTVKYDNRVVISSDEIRKEFPAYDNQKIFELLYKRMNDYLNEGKNVVIDATNITIKSRAQIFNNLKVNCYKDIIIFNIPYEICLERLKIRNKDENSHKVPEEVLRKYYESFEIPFYEEGWDYIGFYNTIPYEDSKTYLTALDLQMEIFNQNNMHHTQLLGKHCKTVAKKIQEYSKDSNLINVGLYHDVGKLFTQTYKENDPNAHYYNHANVGTYELMCNAGIFDCHNEYDKKLTLDWLFYINYHMHMFNIKTEKAERKWRKIFGDTKFENLQIINKADKYRPENEED